MGKRLEGGWLLVEPSAKKRDLYSFTSTVVFASIGRGTALQNRKITYSRLIVLSIDQITTLQCYRSLTIHPHLHPADAIGLQLNALHEHEPSHARHSDRRRESCGADRPGTINLEETPLEKKNWEEKKNLEE